MVYRCVVGLVSQKKVGNLGEDKCGAFGSFIFCNEKWCTLVYLEKIGGGWGRGWGWGLFEGRVLGGRKALDETIIVEWEGLWKRLPCGSFIYFFYFG